MTKTRLREGWLIAGLLVALLVAGIFAVRALSMGRRARFADENIRPWMSVPYLAHSRHIPQGVLWNALGIAPHQHDRRPLGRIAREQKRSVEDVIAKLKSAISDAQIRTQKQTEKKTPEKP